MPGEINSSNRGGLNEREILLVENVSLKQIDMLFKDLDIETDFKTKEIMKEYVNLVSSGMAKCRLTGEQTGSGFIEKQVYDSLYPLKLINIDRTSKLLDLGAGGGLPGIPVKIIKPDLIVTLLDSNKKKALFLKDCINKLRLKDIVVVNKRAEEIGQEFGHREKYNYVFCRAVAKMAVLAELALPLLTIDGEAVFYKGPGGVDELEKAAQAIATCGGVLKSVKHYTLKTGEKRNLIIIKKSEDTPLEFPRKSGLPGKKPI